jgi:AraC family transcriptional regulator
VGSTSIPVTRGAGGTASVDVDGFRVSDLRFRPLVALGLHSHERACLAVVLDGGVDKRFRGTTMEAGAATVVTMPPAEPHEDRFGRAGARIVVVEPDERAVERLRPFARTLDRVGGFEDFAAASVAARLARELAASDRAATIAREGLVLELLATASRAGEPAAARPPRWLAEATEYIRARFRETFRVADVAAAVSVHPAHLARVFREHERVTIGEYVRRLRLEWAAWELARTDAPLAAIAVDAGFADQSHFTRAFKRHAGVTPGRYRTLARR